MRQFTPLPGALREEHQHTSPVYRTHPRRPLGRAWDWVHWDPPLQGAAAVAAGRWHLIRGHPSWVDPRRPTTDGTGEVARATLGTWGEGAGSRTEREVRLLTDLCLLARFYFYIVSFDLNICVANALNDVQ